MSHMLRAFRPIACATAIVSMLATHAHAQQRMVTATVTNLAPTNSVSFARLHVGFHRGLFDSFNIGQTAGDGIISVAEAGSGARWQADFEEADPTATRGIVGGTLTPGSSASMSFLVNTGLNRFFSFASMVVPSNDFFLGNDNAMQYRLFDGMGNLAIRSIFQTTSQIWDAGSETFDPANAAFVGTTALRTAQNGLVSFNFTELEGFNGLRTARDYVFDSQLEAGQNIYRIDFAVATVPEPSTVVLLSGALLVMTLMMHRRRAMQWRSVHPRPAA